MPKCPLKRAGHFVQPQVQAAVRPNRAEALWGLSPKSVAVNRPGAPPF